MELYRNAYLLLGSNLGNRLQYLTDAEVLLAKKCGKVVARSAVYETAAWGLTDQPSFFNRVLHIKTGLLPEDLMTVLLTIEEQLGRVRTVKYGARTIDIDILLIDALVLETAHLVLPHPALPFRKFALLPLAEIAPRLLHPIEKKNIADLLLSCTDDLLVEKIMGNIV